MKKLLFAVLITLFVFASIGCGSEKSGTTKDTGSSGVEVSGGSSGSGEKGDPQEQGAENKGNNENNAENGSDSNNIDKSKESENGNEDKPSTNTEQASDTKNTPAKKPEPAKQTEIGKSATLWVTQDFAGKVFLDKTIQVDKNTTVLSIVQENLEVETAYGGGFINSINGLQSGYTGKLFGGKKMDWFYWVNGIMVAQGGSDYIAEPGDKIWWDYHDWGAGSFVGAVVGAYPQPFVNGFDGFNNGTVIAYTEGHKEAADKVAAALRKQGTKSVTVSPIGNVSVDNRNKITVVVGLWNQLAQQEFFADLNDNSRKTGIYVKFANDGFTSLDYERNEANTYKQGSGAIVATGRGLGDRNPLWIITGVDEGGLNNAVNVMANKPQQLRRKVGVIVTSSGVKETPVK